MLVLIDGHNLIPHLPGLSLADPEDETRLLEILSAYARSSRHTLEVFFDGAPVGQNGRRRLFGLEVHFVPRGRTADDAIAARLAQLGKSARQVAVVSADRRVQSEARSRLAAVWPSAGFARQVVEAGQRTGKESPPADPDVDEWLRLFGGDP